MEEWRRTMEWVDSGKLATEGEVAEFERLHGVRLHPQHRHLLMHVVNGGSPAQEKYIHTEKCPGGAGALHGVYGINPMKTYYDLGSAIENYRFAVPWLVPFGFDQGNGKLFVDMINRPGRLGYTPWEETQEDPMPIYHVADSIDAFLKQSPLPPDDGD